MAKRPPDRTPIRTLFVGNSHTYVNEVNLQVAALARAAGDVAPMLSWRITPGGWSWQRHWSHTGVPGFLSPGAHDCVVLQENSLGWIESHDDTMKYGRLLCNRVREIGATPVLYLTWPRSDFLAIQPMITESCVQIARDCGASVAPAGEAWKLAMAKRTGLVLHSPDRCHANPTGSYLAALVLFATIYNRTPVGLPGRITVTNDKGETKAVAEVRKPMGAFLQSVAWQTVQRFRRRGLVHPVQATPPAGKKVNMIRPNLKDIPRVRFPAGFSIRPIRPGEQALWTDIHRDCERYVPITDALFSDQFGTDFREIGKRCFLIVDARGVAVGTISAWKLDDFRGRPYGLIHWMAVREAYQRRGLARGALAFALRKLARWHQRAVLHTQTQSLPAIKLYLDFGFKPDLHPKGARTAWREVKASLNHPALARVKN